MLRDQMIRIRASKNELARLHANAAAAGLSLSSYLRWRGLEPAHAARARAPRRAPTARSRKTTTRRTAR